ncbi:MAG: FAD-binding protein [Vicinamibacteraceae bacterium]
MSATSNSSTQKAPATSFAPARLEALRASLQGHALVPGDDGYERARRTWDAATFDQHPAIVVMPAVTADVVSAVGFAREHGLPIAVQGAGHGHPRPADDALLLNFANMSRVEVEAATGTTPGIARVEPGAQWRDVIQAAHPHGLAPLNGFAGTVGVVGYLLGGGVGWLARQYGPGAGSIRSVELVTADGRLLQVSEDSYPDLLWGLRGGGGNFGVVTALECTLYPVEEIFGGHVVYPMGQGRDVLSAYVRWARTVPDQLTSAVRLVHFPPIPEIPPPLNGASVIVIMACYNGSASEGEALLRPMRALGTPLVDTFAQIPYAQVGTIANDPPEPPPLFPHMDSGAFGDLSETDLDTILRVAGDRDAGIFLVEIRHFGGALARLPEDAMPFSLRQANWYLFTLAEAPSQALLETGRRSMAAMMSALRPHMTGDLQINALGPGSTGPAQTRAAYSENSYRRLVALKDRYDPDNVFRFNHNIAPSSGG